MKFTSPGNLFKDLTTPTAWTAGDRKRVIKWLASLRSFELRERERLNWEALERAFKITDNERKRIEISKLEIVRECISIAIKTK